MYTTMMERALEKKVKEYEAGITDTIVVLNRIAEERDEWRNVADLLAAELDDTTEGFNTSALTKFKELEKKYPL